MAECFVQTSGNSMNQGIGTSVQKNWRRREWDMMFFIKEGPLNRGGEVEIFKPWKTPCNIFFES